ncbi:type II secretion system protein F [Gemmobacter tilapiae]|uniref:Type II secretion system protein F n=2 Tax=Neogemmobacter tilapiae TaxID=875041 RepID=A0A918WPG7_9RHOB|nr:type II secretion system protein F [Gemmobacter tilapiae]
MALMLGSGMTLPQATRLLGEGAENQQIRRSFDRINRLVADGTDFPKALEGEAQAFSPLFVPLVEVSYASRNPVVILNSLSTFLRRQDNLRSEVGAALVYPAILLVGAAFMVIFLAIYLAPNLAPMFSSMGQEVPALIAAMVRFGELLAGYWFVFALLTGVLVGTLFLIWPRVSSRLRRFAFRMPKVGTVMATLSLARLSRTSALLLGSGLPLAVALRRTAELMPREPAGDSFTKAAQQLEGGGTASDIFVADSRLPQSFKEMFRYGETTNTLPLVLASVAASFESRAERQMQSLTRLIVPLVTLVVGGAVAAIVYLVMGAVLSVNDLGTL